MKWLFKIIKNVLSDPGRYSETVVLKKRSNLFELYNILYNLFNIVLGASLLLYHITMFPEKPASLTQKSSIEFRNSKVFSNLYRVPPSFSSTSTITFKSPHNAPRALYIFWDGKQVLPYVSSHVSLAFGIYQRYMKVHPWNCMIDITCNLFLTITRNCDIAIVCPQNPNFVINISIRTLHVYHTHIIFYLINFEEGLL